MQSLKQRLEFTSRNLRPRPNHPVPIVLAITDLDGGGAERALMNLALGLDRRRWEPFVVNLSGDGEFADVIRSAGIPVESLGMSRRRPLQGLVRLVQSLRRRRPALIQSFLFHANILSRVAGPLAGSPWVLGGIRVAEHQKRWHLGLDRLTNRLGCGSVCVSSGVLQFSQSTGGLDPARLTVIPNGVDPSRFDSAVKLPRDVLGIPEDAVLALTVGRLDVQKGLPDLLNALVQAGASGDGFRLAIVGNGPLRGWLESEVHSRKDLREQVRILGRRDDVPSLMRSADLLIHAAHWEGMPNVVLEAMAAKLPVIATDVEGVEELIVPGQTGWVVPRRDPQTLGETIRNARLDRKGLSKMGESARLRVEAKFSLNTMISCYDALWSSILGYNES